MSAATSPSSGSQTAAAKMDGGSSPSSKGKTDEMSTTVVNLADFHRIAKHKMDKIDYDYYASGSLDEATVKRNMQSWAQYCIWPRFCGSADLATVELETSLRLPSSSTPSAAAGTTIPLKMPVMVCPMALQKLAHPDGEVGLARAAAKAGILYCITQQASTKVETICAESKGGPKMFQMYIFRNRALTERLIRRCEKCEDIRALVVTVDSPVLGRRERDIRNKFTPKSRGVEISNWKEEPTKAASNSGSGASSSSSAGGQSAVASSAFKATTPAPSVVAVASRIGGRDAGFRWSDLAWLRSVTNLPIIVKGVLHPIDAILAAENGTAAVWVSNHGGRQADSAVGCADAFPHIRHALQRWAAAKSDRTIPPLIVDGGVRRGQDVLRGLLLGADVVSVGRPFLWALAADGERGADSACSILRDEVTNAMQLAGVSAVGKAKELGRELLIQKGTEKQAFERMLGEAKL
ncbi:unnamed protein product [Amoebophrya sp. A25]|nr:unnamed protein product [Amoebophrya sp. A25]|eukprot:GSA25T00012258001.1